MDYVPAPNVITTLTIKKINFTFRVHAYRTLNAAEMRFALRKWMDDTRRKKSRQIKLLIIAPFTGLIHKLVYKGMNPTFRQYKLILSFR